MTTAVDTSVLLDILTDDPRHASNSEAALAEARAVGRLVVSESVVAELRPALDSDRQLTAFLHDVGIEFLPATQESAMLAGSIYASYPKNRGPSRRVLPDFLIAAHARLNADRLLAGSLLIVSGFHFSLPLLPFPHPTPIPIGAPMSRPPRLERTGLYHVINRGVEKRTIFLDRGDHLSFLELVEELKSLYAFDVRAWCLMYNHYHLLVETKNENLSLIVKQLNHKYTIYFNRKYDRVGTLWQGRFKSWYVYDNRYLDVLIKYIERNPIKAGLCSRLGEYEWSSRIAHDASFGPDELAALTEFHAAPLALSGALTAAPAQRSLNDHFDHLDLSSSPDTTLRNQAILNAVLDGHPQTRIARFCGLSDAAISKIMKGLAPRRPGLNPNQNLSPSPMPEPPPGM